jgi:GT2 family glycosyltransferase
LFDCDARPTAPFAARIQNAFAARSDIGAIAFVQNDHRPDLRPASEPPPTLAEFIIGSAFHSRLPKTIRTLLSAATAQLCIHSCCMAVRKSDFEAVGGFDENFDFLDADVDFSWRLLHRGLTNQVDPNLICFHPGGGSPQSTGRRVLRYHQNRWRLLRKHGVAGPEDLVKTLLAVRHSIECLTLTCLSLLPGPKQAGFLDKLKTRRQLLTHVVHDYAF